MTWQPNVDEGWLPVVDRTLAQYDLRFPWYEPCEFMRSGWDKPATFVLKDVNPAFNVSGLYWRNPPAPHTVED